MGACLCRYYPSQPLQYYGAARHFGVKSPQTYVRQVPGECKSKRKEMRGRKSKGNFFDEGPRARAATAVAGQYKVVCYYGSWAADRKPPMTFGASDIPADKCTHVIYAFAGLDDGGRIVSLNPQLDIQRGVF